MRKYLLISGLILSAFIFPESVIAQESKKAGDKEEVKSANEKELKRTNYNTNIYTNNPVFKGVELDKRVAKYYPENDLNEMEVQKLKQLNFIYLKSFEVVNYTKLSDECKQYISQQFDLGGGYEMRRKENERVNLDIIKDGFSFKISLLSRNELSKAMANIF